MPGPYELELTGRDEVYGASELPVMHGVDPYGRDLHSMFVHKIDHVVEPPTKRMMYGKYFEDAIRLVACAETGKNFLPSFNKTYRHPEFPKYHLVATPDALNEDESDGGLECKLLSNHQRHHCGPTADDIPPHFELQIRGTMAVMQRPRWYLAVWCGDRPLIYTIERDLEFEAFILDRAEREWKRYFEAKVRPPIGGSKISAAWLQQKWPTHKRPDIRPATDAEIELLTEYGNLRVEQKRLKEARAKLENQLKEAIQDREGLEWTGGRFTWRRTKDSTWVDWESMAIGLRTFHIKDEEARAKLTEEYTHIKAGVRRIWFSSDQFSETEEAADAA
jgi:predicted phage-related endonuclease